MTSTSSVLPSPIPQRTLPIRSQPGAVPARTQPPQPVSATGSINPGRAPTEIGPVKRLHFSGRGAAALDALERDIISVIKQLKSTTKGGEDEETELFLIIDQPDLLLAATGPGKGIGATEMGDWVLGLQQVR